MESLRIDGRVRQEVWAPRKAPSFLPVPPAVEGVLADSVGG